MESVYQTEAQWTADERVFTADVVAITTDGANIGKHKLMDGVHRWSQLSYVEASTGSTTHLIWEGYLTQSGTDAPTVFERTNTLGGTPVLAYVAEGLYTATLAGAFTPSRTSAYLGPATLQSAITSGQVVEIGAADSDTLAITCGVIGSNVSEDNVLTDTYFKITVAIE